MAHNSELQKKVESGHLTHFTYLPERCGHDIRHIDGVTLVISELPTSMFNIAYGLPITLSLSDFISHVKSCFTPHPFAWWVPPCAYHPSINQLFFANGFILETIEHAMICNLSTNKPYSESETKIKCRCVNDIVQFEDFIALLERYDSHVRTFYEQIAIEDLVMQEQLFVGYADNKPVSIGALTMTDNHATLFNLLTAKEQRKKGYGKAMMCELMKIAMNHDCTTISLSASSDSGYRIYEQLGFCKIGTFGCFEYFNKDY